jgi:hypothetical protein
MLEKLVQAAIITFLLHLVAGVSSKSAAMPSNGVSPTAELSSPVAKARVLPYLQ